MTVSDFPVTFTPAFGNPPYTAVYPFPRKSQGPPQLHCYSFPTYRRLLHRGRYSCSFPVPPEYPLVFAHRTGARLSRFVSTSLAMIPDVSPLRCLRSFVFLRSAGLPRRSDCLEVPRFRVSRLATLSPRVDQSRSGTCFGRWSGCIPTLDNWYGRNVSFV